VGEKLDIWPALPIVLAQYDWDWRPKRAMNNIAAAFKQNNRICKIGLLGVPASQMGEILAAIHESFPVLTHLWLDSDDETVSVNPDLFLGGSVPRLQFLQLVHIPFPGLPKLLFSATHLSDLRLFNLSRSGYISPESMVSCFSALTGLETLILDFECPESFPIREHRPPPPPTRTLLPALTWLHFHGISEYLEDLVDRVDTPLLDDVTLYRLDQFIPDTAQLAEFINRSPKLKAHNEAQVVFYDGSVHLTLPRLFSLSYEVTDSQVSSVAQVYTSSLSQAFSATIERLYICDDDAYWRGDIRVENDHWMELLRPFTSVKSLYLSRVIVPHIAPALQELVGERVAGALPALQLFSWRTFWERKYLD